MIFATKYHGLGNDFLIVAADQLDEVHYSQLSASICEPHFGIGADGCIIVRALSSNSAEIRIFNRDGSEAGMSGNGARCATAYLHHKKMVSESRVDLLTISGPKTYTLLESDFPRWRYRSAMGTAEFAPAMIPFLASQGVEEVRDYEISIESGETVRINALSVGNPQCVVFEETLSFQWSFDRLGRLLSTHSCFPQDTNVSFVTLGDEGQIQARIWERGVGPTHSSGTGSCGAAIASIRAGLVESPVVVKTETGSQIVEWAEGEEIHLTGEAVFVADAHFFWNRD